jgi:multidrug efflux pump subunit AcrA (membrane-fusion protein)
MKRYFFPASLLLLIAIASCKQKNETLFPSLQPITQSVYASGVVKGYNQYQVFAKTTGVLTELYVSEGDMVKEGENLLLISNNTAKINQENAEVNARFNASQNNLDKLEELALNIEVLKEKKTNDSLLLQRQLNLWKQNVGTQVEVEQKQLAYKNAQTNYASALLRYKQLKRQISFASEQSKINLQLSNTLYGDFLVKSEITGKVYDILKKEGEMVTSQTPVAVVGDASRFYLELQIDEFDITQIKLDQQVFVTMDSYKGKVFEAKVSKIHPMMNEKSKSFLVEATFIKQPENLYPNLTVEANIVIRSKEKALLIPRNYLTADNKVLLENGNLIEVKTGLMDYKMIEIIAGISETDALLKP